MEFIPYARPSVGPEEEAAMLAVLRSGWLTTGKAARAFEEEFAAFLGVPACLAVNSATSGLHLALEALGVGPGDRVVTSPYTFVATAAVARHLGAEVLFCDVAEGSYNLDPDALEELLRREGDIKAALSVHVGGLPCDMARILEVCGSAGVRVVEDAAHAFPSRTPAGYAGTLGDIGVYSLYANKTITSGEGGMIAARDPALLKRMATMRSHGFDRDAWDRYTSTKPAWFYDVVEAGYKYNLPDLLAALGREQLKKAETFLAERREIAAFYLEALAGEEAYELPPTGLEETARGGAVLQADAAGGSGASWTRLMSPAHAWHLFALRLRPGRLRIGRDELIAKLAERGIGASVHFIPLHTMSYWSRRYLLKPEDFPRALGMFERSLSLPIWQGMGLDRARRVAETLLDIAREERV